MFKKIALTLTIIALLAIVAACAGPTPEKVIEKVVETVVVKETVQVEKEVVKEVEKIVEKEVKVESAGALTIPYPEGIEVNLGAAEVKRLPISEMVTYKALPEYKEPAWITKLVEAGKLPPVKDRLPKEPQVVLTAGMPTGIGVYGDAWRDFSACPTAGWNFTAGVTSGWFGIDSNSDSYNSLVRIGPLFRTDQDIEPLPQLAKSWEWSADGKQLTMHLIEGAKWSDGEPFTADDVMFTWEGYVNDANVNSTSKISNWTWPDGSVAKLEKVDDFTIMWTFPVPKPTEKFYNMKEQAFDIMPAHILKAVHPKWSETNKDYKVFENALPGEAMPQVTMGPFVAVEYKTDELLIMRRNPYFWKVDESGQQLPYLDEAVYQKGPSGTGRTLCTMAGGCDHTNVENPASEYLPALKRAAEPDAHFSLNWGPETLGYFIMINQSADLGVKDEKEAAMRELFRDVRFRQALSHATDRDGLAQATVRGSLLRAWPGGLYPGAPEYDRTSVVYYPYAPDAAKNLLAQLGFEDTDGNSIVNWTSGPLKGEDLAVAISSPEDQQESVNLGEALVNMYAQVGIKVNFRPVTSAARTDIAVSGEWQMYVYRGGQEFVLPFARCEALAPYTKGAPEWHREGDKPRTLQPFEEELVKIVQAYCPESDPVKRKELINQYNKIFTENVYDVGIFVGRYGLAVAKRFQNVAPGIPAFMYTWVEDAIMAEQVWTPVDQQVKQIRPNVIPVGQPKPAGGK